MQKQQNQKEYMKKFQKSDEFKNSFHYIKLNQNNL